MNQTNKFWYLAVSRIDNVYGDRNLVCSCEDYFTVERLKCVLRYGRYGSMLLVHSKMKLPKSMMILSVLSDPLSSYNS